MARTPLILPPKSHQSARIGGEEFAILMPGIDSAGALVRAKLPCKEIFRLRIPHAGNSSAVVTVSIGVASTTAHGDAMDMVRAGDVALYKAKAQGRNQVVQAE